jgi:1-acyl-sn-glycerol-3-phosphate acyltransferase
MQAWPGETEQVLVRPKGLQWLRVVLRACAILLSVFALILPMYALRRLGFRRQSQQLVRLACRGCLWAAGLKLSVEGEPIHRSGAIVSNHASWLDIFVLNAVHRVFFVAKSEVRNWPIIGLVARAVGTVFVRRSALDAASQVDTILERINQGDRLLFFPEGTSTDGQRVLPFKSTLFAAFFDDDLKDALWVQPVTLNYRSEVLRLVGRYRFRGASGGDTGAYGNRRSKGGVSPADEGFGFPGPQGSGQADRGTGSQWAFGSGQALDIGAQACGRIIAVPDFRAKGHKIHHGGKAFGVFEADVALCHHGQFDYVAPPLEGFEVDRFAGAQHAGADRPE